MKIAALSWRGVAGLPDGAAELVAGGVPSDIVVVTGPSGSGKSRLLLSVVAAKERLAPYGPGVPDEAIAGNGAAKIAIDWWFSDEERADVGLDAAHHHSEVLFPKTKGVPAVQGPAVNELLSRYSHSPRIGKIDYVPPNRTMPLASSASGDSEFDQKRRRLSAGSEKYAAVRRLAVELVRRGGQRAEELSRLFTALCPHMKLGGVTATNDLELVRSSGRGVPVSRASSSEWEAFLLAATVVIIGLHGSVLLYDTPELHIDGKEAARRLLALHTAIPTTQIIVATKAEEIVGLESARVVRLGGSS